MSTDAKTATSVKDLEITHEGTSIKLPLINGKPMAYDEACLWLKRKKEEEEKEYAPLFFIDCAPLDGAVAFHKAVAQTYGFSIGRDSMFSPPMMIGVPISTTDKQNVPWGKIEIPGITGYLQTGLDASARPKFVLSGVIRKKHADEINKLVKLTEQIVRENSIYRGKAVKISFKWIELQRENERGFDPIEDAPKFMELNGVSESDLIFGDAVMASLNIGLFTPIEQSAACRKYKVPLKRGVLLHGPYGTGKTMTAYISAMKASRNGWTFIYLDDVTDLKHALDFAAQYAPAVVFAEDVDRAVTGERSMDMDAILNILDGVDTKGKEIITVLTTNHLEEINPAMLRPGRLDTLVEVLPPDAKAAARIVTLYARGLLEEGADLARIGEELAGNIPAFLREVVERAKIAAISRLDGQDIEGKVLAEDILNAAYAMKNHANLIKPKAKNPKKTHEVYVVQKDATNEDNVEDLTGGLKKHANG